MGAHDALFKHTFSVPEHAAAVLAEVLPAVVSARIDWSTLRLEPGSFVDDELAAKHTDLLFSARTLSGDAELCFYLLFEHQSGPDRWMPLRMAGYVVRILDRARTAAPARLPVVIPVVLHHGGEGWTAARSMRALYGADESVLDALGERALGLEIHVEDLAALPASAIVARRAPVLVRLVLGVLRDARELTLDALLARWGPLMIEAARTLGRDALVAIVQYLLSVRQIEDRSVLLAATRAHGGTELEEIAMNALEKERAEGKAEGRAEGKAEGRAEGKAEGRAEGKAEVLVRQLRLRFGALAPELEARVRSASAEALDAMAERILSAPTAADVVGRAS